MVVGFFFMCNNVDSAAHCNSTVFKSSGLVQQDFPNLESNLLENKVHKISRLRVMYKFNRTWEGKIC